MSLFGTGSGMDEDAFDPATLMRIATVASVDLATARCVVEIGDIVSPPLPWLERAMGNTRTWSPPVAGEQVYLLCAEGELGGGVILRGIPSDQFAPVGNSEEELILFTDGARIAYDPVAHRLSAVLPGGATAELTAETITFNGNVTINGDATVTGTVTGQTDVIGDGKSLKGHKHGGVSAGGAQSGPPA